VRNDVYRKEFFDMGKTIAEHLKEEGREEGREEGVVRTQRRMLLSLLRNRFGKIPAAMVKRIEATERIELLDAWFDQALAAKKLEDVPFDAG
jgi:predicted transposase YdaD